LAVRDCVQARRDGRAELPGDGRTLYRPDPVFICVRPDERGMAAVYLFKSIGDPAMRGWR